MREKGKWRERKVDKGWGHSILSSYQLICGQTCDRMSYANEIGAINYLQISRKCEHHQVVFTASYWTPNVVHHPIYQKEK